MITGCRNASQLPPPWADPALPPASQDARNSSMILFSWEPTSPLIITWPSPWLPRSERYLSFWYHPIYPKTLNLEHSNFFLVFPHIQLDTTSFAVSEGEQKEKKGGDFLDNVSEVVWVTLEKDGFRMRDWLPCSRARRRHYSAAWWVWSCWESSSAFWPSCRTNPRMLCFRKRSNKRTWKSGIRWVSVWLSLVEMAPPSLWGGVFYSAICLCVLCWAFAKLHARVVCVWLCRGWLTSCLWWIPSLQSSAPYKSSALSCCKSTGVVSVCLSIRLLVIFPIWLHSVLFSSEKAA